MWHIQHILFSGLFSSPVQSLNALSSIFLKIDGQPKAKIGVEFSNQSWWSPGAELSIDAQSIHISFS